MKYQLTDYVKSAPVVDNGDGTSSQQIIMIINVVGDTYGFVPPVGKPNTTTIIYPNKFKDQDQINAYIEQEATAFVAATYPDTP